MTDDEKRIELLTKWNEQIKEAFNNKTKTCEHLRKRIAELEKEMAAYKHAKRNLELNYVVLGLVLGLALGLTLGLTLGRLL